MDIHSVCELPREERVSVCEKLPVIHFEGETEVVKDKLFGFCEEICFAVSTLALRQRFRKFCSLLSSPHLSEKHKSLIFKITNRKKYLHNNGDFFLAILVSGNLVKQKLCMYFDEKNQTPWGSQKPEWRPIE